MLDTIDTFLKDHEHYELEIFYSSTDGFVRVNVIDTSKGTFVPAIGKIYADNLNSAFLQLTGAIRAENGKA